MLPEALDGQTTVFEQQGRDIGDEGLAQARVEARREGPEEAGQARLRLQEDVDHGGPLQEGTETVSGSGVEIVAAKESKSDSGRNYSTTA